MSNKYAFLFAAIVAGFIAGALGGYAVNRVQAPTDGDTASVREQLLADPEIVREALLALQRRQEEADAVERRAAIADNADEIFRSPDDFAAGNPDGDVTVVEFFDYNCPYCKRALADMNELLKNDPNLRFVLKEFPILGDDSVEVSRYALAAKMQGKYLEFHTALLGVEGRVDGARALSIAEDIGLDVERLKTDAESDDISVTIGSVKLLAAQLGINGTPGYVVGDELIPGAIGAAGISEKIAKVRAEAKSAKN